jgi:Protein of unknown function (DUF2894)
MMTEAGTAGCSQALEQLQADLNAMKASSADGFDPPRFHFIESMLARAREHSGAARDLVALKAATAFQQYQADFAQAQQEAQTLIDRVTAHYPACSEALQSLFDGSEFRALKRRAARLERCDNQTALASISGMIQNREASADEKPGGNRIEDLLQQQEHQILASLSAGPGDPDYRASGHRQPDNPKELKSARRFRQSRHQHSADKRVSQAVKASPEDSGPLNAHRLVIRSLEAMRAISPHYTRQFATYIDTLLWLEQAAAKTRPAGTGHPGTPQRHS